MLPRHRTRAFIRQCRHFGFGIDQVRALLELSALIGIVRRRGALRGHLDQVRAKVAQLRQLESRLEGFVQRCDAAAKPADRIDPPQWHTDTHRSTA